jgi:hypothetical protein
LSFEPAWSRLCDITRLGDNRRGVETCDRKRRVAVNEMRSGWIVKLGDADDPYYLTARGVLGTIATAGWFSTREEAEHAAADAGCPEGLVVSAYRLRSVPPAAD